MKAKLEIKIKFKRYKLNENATFLIVEDQKEIQIALGRDLRRIGFKGDVYCCEDLRDAKEAIRDLKVEIIFLDMNLKNGEKGLDFLKYLKMKRIDTPVIVVTSEDDVDMVMQAINEGANEFIIKPWDRETLIKKISYSVVA